MKKQVGILMAAMVMATSLSYAQPAGTPRQSRQQMTPEQVAGQRAESQKKHLSLTDKQAKEVEKLNLEYAKKRQSRVESQDKQREKNREAARAEREKYDKEMKKILTPEQYATWQEEQARHQAQMGNRTNGRSQAHRPGHNGPRDGRNQSNIKNKQGKNCEGCQYAGECTGGKCTGENCKCGRNKSK